MNGPILPNEIEEAGADALELNIFILPSITWPYRLKTSKAPIWRSSGSVRNEIKIPIAVKMSYYFSNLAGMIAQLSRTNIAGLVLFNRSYSPDIDIERMESHIHQCLQLPAATCPFRCAGLPSWPTGSNATWPHPPAFTMAKPCQAIAGRGQCRQVVSALYENGFRVPRGNDLENSQNG